MRWYRRLSTLQKRILLGLTVSMVIVLGIVGWIVGSTLTSLQALTPLPTPTYADSVLGPPTPDATPTITPSPSPTLTPTNTPTPVFDIAEAGLIAAEIADARGVTPRWSTPLTLMSKYDLTVLLHQRYQELRPLPLEMQPTLDALGLWFWEDVTLDVVAQSKEVAAFYAPEAEELYLCRDWTGDMETLKLQLAYSYARAIPDQYGNLPQLVEEAATLDRKLALAAVAEGDALMALWLYTGAEPGSQRAGELSDLIAGSTLPHWNPEDPLLEELSRLPLELGSEFTQARYAEAGFEGLETAIIRPPRSTEQLLHPERYADNEEPMLLLPLSPPLQETWVLTNSDTLGEALMGLIMLEWSNNEVQSTSVENWGNDLLQIWEDSQGGRVVLWQTIWDSSRDAARFHAHLIEVLPTPILRGLVNDTTTPALLPPGRWWAGRQGAIYLRRYANRVWIIWGNDESAVETIGSILQ